MGKNNQGINFKNLFITVILLFAVFSLGFSVSYFISLMQDTQNQNNLLLTTNAPSDFISEDKITVYPDKVIIQIDNASLSSYAPTGSMRPLFDSGANGIRIIPKSPDNIHIGDIISFGRDSGLIVHRVVEKGTDEQGVYFITKGDNNQIQDGKVRFSEIRYLTVGVLY